MKCPYCGEDYNSVIDSRPSENGDGIRRRRECIKCGKRFTTYEKPEPIVLYVIKKDNTREPFEKDKIRKGIQNSCRKRPVTPQIIEKLVNDIENEVYSLGEREVKSSRIGELIMEKLKKVDEVAYVRFASVYHEFKDVETFVTEIQNMHKN
jgi:transcriptional repressor NrdR